MYFTTQTQFKAREVALTTVMTDHRLERQPPIHPLLHLRRVVQTTLPELRRLHHPKLHNHPDRRTLPPPRILHPQRRTANVPDTVDAARLRHRPDRRRQVWRPGLGELGVHPTDHGAQRDAAAEPSACGQRVELARAYCLPGGGDAAEEEDEQEGEGPH
jgi:hypothetical protein